MKENDKRMEDFFRRSMDQFNESPSQDVWDQLSDKLTSEETFGTKAMRWVRVMIPFLVLFFLLGSLSIYSYQTISELKINNTTLINQKQKLNDSLSELTNLNSSLERKQQNIQSELQSCTSVSSTNAFDIEKSKKVLANAIYQNSQISKDYKLAKALNEKYEEQISSLNNELLAFKRNSITEINKNNTRTAINIIPPSKRKAANLNLTNAEDPLDRWSPLDYRSKYLATSDQEEEENLFGGIKYRYGVTARGFNTFVKNSREINFGNSYGLLHELSFGKRWSLTHGAHYNDQEYTVDAVQGGLAESILKKFPDNPSDYANVRSVKSQAKYLDTQVGIKYQIPNKKNNGYYFINPSAVWQLYFPQEFSYNIIQAQDLLVQKRGYIGYFGSINLQLGMEKSLSENMSFQLAVFAERSLIELGHDKQYITMLGIKSSVLFGK